MRKQPSKLLMQINPINSQLCSQQSIFDQSAKALQILQQLFKMRLIDRIARPRQRIDKQQDVNNYATKLQSLHDSLFKIKNEITTFRSSQNGSLLSKKVMLDSSKNKMNTDLKKSIRSIQSKYSQILIYGSFKYCRKICETFNLNYTSRLSLMMVDQWANSCLEDNSQQGCC